MNRLNEAFRSGQEKLQAFGDQWKNKLRVGNARRENPRKPAESTDSRWEKLKFRNKMAKLFFTVALVAVISSVAIGVMPPNWVRHNPIIPDVVESFFLPDGPEVAGVQTPASPTTPITTSETRLPEPTATNPATTPDAPSEPEFSMELENVNACYPYVRPIKMFVDHGEDGDSHTFIIRSKAPKIRVYDNDPMVQQPGCLPGIDPDGDGTYEYYFPEHPRDRTIDGFSIYNDENVDITMMPGSGISFADGQYLDTNSRADGYEDLRHTHPKPTETP